MANARIMTDWQEAARRVFEEMEAWRRAHPRATFAEIEGAVEEHLSDLRGQLIEDVVEASPSTDLAGRPAGERPRCPECGQAMEARGKRERAVTIRGNRTVRLQRSYAVCPACGAGVFPPR